MGIGIGLGLSPVLGGGPAFTPRALAPYAWYEAGTYAAGAYDDLSGNGRDDATDGASAPLNLPYTGTAYLHLEAATSGTNSLSCTAPANTASYSAAPLGGGAPTTGAASAGAFSFTTNGNWTSVSLLDGGGATLARYDAASSTKTGMTDSFSVAWTVNYGTAGGRSVVLSPLAVPRARSLFRTDNSITVPANAIPPLGATDPWTFVVVARQWATALTTGRWFDNKSGSGGTIQGVALRNTSTTLALGTVVADGTANATVNSTSAFTSGDVVVAAAVCTAGTSLVTYANAAASTPSDTSAIGSRDPAAAGAIGKIRGSNSSYAEFEWFAFLSFNRAVTTNELALLRTYYGVGS